MDQRNAEAEDLVERVVEAEPLVLARRHPPFQLDDELDALRRSGRRDAEQLLHVDHAEAAQLHVVPRQLGARADEDRLLAAAHFHRVVGDEAVAAMNQIERALALADAALSGDEDAEAEDVHQHRVDHRPLGERVLEQRRQLGNRHRRDDRRLEQRQPRALRLAEQLGRRREAAGDHHARKIERQREAQRLGTARRLEALEVADLALAENQDATRLQVLVKAGEGEAGLLDVRAGDDAIDAGPAGEQLDGQAVCIGPARKELSNGDA